MNMTQKQINNATQRYSKLCQPLRGVMQSCLIYEQGILDKATAAKAALIAPPATQDGTKQGDWNE